MTTATKAARDAWRTILDLVFERGRDRVREASASVGLSPGLLRALFHVGGGEGIAMRDIAERWGCDPSYVTSLADALEARGLARRASHPTDRRVKIVVLTEEGAQTRERALSLLYEPPAAFRTLTSTEQRELRDLLRKVAEADRPGAARSEGSGR